MSEQQNSTPGPSRTVKSSAGIAGRSCDRCRKRKARCDEGNPCKLCADAGLQCTFNAPVLKRGPRPKTERTVENRLRNLEQLLALISREPTDQNVSLSEEKLAGIRAAAQCSPGSAGAQASSNSPGDNLNNNDPGTVPYSFGTTPGPWNAKQGSGYSGGTGVGIGMEGYGSTSASIPADQFQGPAEGGGSMDNLWYNLSMEVGRMDVNPSDRNGHLNLSSGPRQSPPVPLPNARTVLGIASTPSRHDLLYQDARGQKKWLGASSGMPLLDLLKELNVPEDIPRRDYSTAEDWISMSTASGLEGYPFSADPSAGPSSSMATLPQPVEPQQASPALDDLWPRVTAIAGQTLLDSLVGAYFTISHLLWPILHAPQFKARYSDPQKRREPSFVALVISMACLSSRYIGDLDFGVATEMARPIGLRLVELCKSILANEASDIENLEVVQAIFNLAVYLGGTSKPYTGLLNLSRGITISLQLGLHRRVDDWESISQIEIEERKRTFWAQYCLGVENSATFGVPPPLRLADCDVSEPLPVDDVYITEDNGVQPWPEGNPSVMAGFVASIRLHTILERAVTRINQVSREEGARTTFLNMALATSQPSTPLHDEITLTDQFALGLHGDWTFTSSTIAKEDSVHFFRKTRAFTLQHFIRLLVARHRFLTLLAGKSGSTPNGQDFVEELGVLQQVTQAALGIIGTYATILAHGRLGMFGVHAIVQLSQAGAGLIGVILQVQGKTLPSQQHLLRLAIQGLSSSIAVLRHLGQRRPAGTVSATVLEEFSKACRLPVVAPLPSKVEGAVEPSSADSSVPLLRALPRRMSRTGHRADLDMEFPAEMTWDEMLRSVTLGNMGNPGWDGMGK